MTEVFDNDYKLIESEIENCFRTTILKGQWGRGAGSKGVGGHYLKSDKIKSWENLDQKKSLVSLPAQEAQNNTGNKTGYNW